MADAAPIFNSTALSSFAEKRELGRSIDLVAVQKFKRGKKVAKQ
jgi:hypothetical protein